MSACETIIASSLDMPCERRKGQMMRAPLSDVGLLRRPVSNRKVWLAVWLTIALACPTSSACKVQSPCLGRLGSQHKEGALNSQARTLPAQPYGQLTRTSGGSGRE